MKKHVILAVVVVAALVVAGTSGVFATWSDSEISYGNTIETGSLDLKVNGADDDYWGEGVPTKVTVECMIPQKFYGPYEVELWNAGQCNFPAHAFIHVRNVVCDNVEPKVNPIDPADGGSDMWPRGETTGYPDPSIGMPYSGDLKPEPELVAEYGGYISNIWVPGVGVEGDDCSMGSGVRMIITNSTDIEDVLVNPDGRRLVDLLGKWECKEIYLFDLMPCQPRTIYLWFYLTQDDEEDYGLDYIPEPDDLGLEPGDPGYDEAVLFNKKFNDWPSCVYMKDMARFEMEFDLWLEDTPGAIVSPPNDD